MGIEEFLEQLKGLSRGASFKPHKYLLLLSILDLVRVNESNNRFYFDQPLKEAFSKYLELYGSASDSNRPYTPFFHLQSSGFWHLKAKLGRETILSQMTSVGGPADITDNVDHAYLSEWVYRLFVSEGTATKIREAIVSILNDRRESEDNLGTDGIVESLFAHERRAIQSLVSAVGRLGKVLNNVHIRDSQSGIYYEYDVILLSTSGLYVIELKHWTGTIQVGSYNWVINETVYRPDPHKVNGLKCKVLKGICQHHFRTYPDYWVESVVILTNKEAVVTGSSDPVTSASQGAHNLTFTSISQFVTYLRSRSVLSNVLSQSQVDSLAGYIQSLNSPAPPRRYTVPGYETVEYIEQSQHYLELVAHPVDGRRKGLYRFRVFRVPDHVSSEEKTKLIKRAYNTVNAVSQMDGHPNIHRVWVVQNDIGDIIEGSEWSDTGTLRDYISRSSSLLTPENVLSICEGIARGLTCSHSVGVIHRAVRPEHVLMMNGIPKLTHFDLSYQLEDEHHVTVMPDISRIRDDGYIAPEILQGKDIDEGTDFFSLGVIAYELLTGRKPFKSVRSYIAQGGIPTPEITNALRDRGLSQRCVDTISGLLVADRSSRLRDGQAILAAFADELVGSPGKANAELKPGETYDVYEIVELLNRGAHSQIYRAKTLRSAEVILKVYDREVPTEVVLREYDMTSAVNSAYVVRCHGVGHWKDDRFFLVLDYVKGSSMRSHVDQGKRPDLATFRTVALCLLEGMSAFHYHTDADGRLQPLVHGDVKPDNILITDDHKAVLIDCGIAGEPRVGAFEGTYGYMPSDSICGTDVLLSEDTDRFALGVSLLEWLTGGKDSESLSRLPAEFKEYEAWLAKATASDASSRFASTEEMRSALARCGVREPMQEPTSPVPLVVERADVQAPRVEASYAARNRFVTYLNSLSNSSPSNENAIAEIHLLSEFFSRVVVPHPIAEYIYEVLYKQRRNVILTGNAGDGKTTIAAEVVRRLTGEYRTLRPEEFLESADIVIVKDFSEMTSRKRYEVLTQAHTAPIRRFLIVSNSGILLDALSADAPDGLRVDESTVLTALEKEGPQELLGGRFVLVNLGRTDSISTGCAVLKRFLDKANWQVCESCSYAELCPILVNVKLLSENLETALSGVERIYRRLYEYGTRLTMRQMVGHLAYSITAGRDCARIHGMSTIALQDSIPDSLFSNRFFGDNGRDIAPESMQLEPVRRIREVEFGADLDPDFEHRVWRGDSTVLGLFGTGRTVLGMIAPDFKVADRFARMQVRRLAFFFSQAVAGNFEHYAPTFLRSPTLSEVLDLRAEWSQVSPLRERDLRLRILRVFQEHMFGIRLPENSVSAKDLYLTSCHKGSPTATYRILAEVRKDDFRLQVYTRYQVGSTITRYLGLSYLKDGPVLELDLPFLDYVTRRFDGEVAEELSPFYAERLERFKMEILNRVPLDDRVLRLVRLDHEGGFKTIRIAVNGNRLEVI